MPFSTTARPHTTSGQRPSYPRRQKPLPISARSLEEVLVSRRQSQSLISSYERARPPLEMLELEKERRRNAKRPRNPDYPGVTGQMMRSTSAGVLRFGGLVAATAAAPGGGAPGGGRMERLPEEMYMVDQRKYERRRDRDRGPGAAMGGAMSSAMPMTAPAAAQNADSREAFPLSDSAVAVSAASESPNDEPNPDIVDALTRQCNHLAWRLMAVEKELVEKNKRTGYGAYREEHGDVLGAEGGEWGDMGEFGEFEQFGSTKSSFKAVYDEAPDIEKRIEEDSRAPFAAGGIFDRNSATYDPDLEGL